MEVDKFVSVVASVRNEADILESFVKEATAVLSENYANYELIIVDDDSEDGTEALVTEMLQEYENIRYQRLSRQFGE